MMADLIHDSGGTCPREEALFQVQEVGCCPRWGAGLPGKSPEQTGLDCSVAQWVDCLLSMDGARVSIPSTV